MQPDNYMSYSSTWKKKSKLAHTHVRYVSHYTFNLQTWQWDTWERDKKKLQFQRSKYACVSTLNKEEKIIEKFHSSICCQVRCLFETPSHLIHCFRNLWWMLTEMVQTELENMWMYDFRCSEKVMIERAPFDSKLAGIGFLPHFRRL